MHPEFLKKVFLNLVCNSIKGFLLINHNFLRFLEIFYSQLLMNGKAVQCPYIFQIPYTNTFLSITKHLERTYFIPRL